MAVTYMHYHDVSKAKLPKSIKDELSDLFNNNLHIAHRVRLNKRS